MTGQREPAGATGAARGSSRAPFLLVAAAAAGALVWGVHAHRERDALAAEAQRATLDFRPLVRTIVAKREPGAVELALPGETVAFEEARIFARATGFLAERRADIGTRVRAGELLARIAAPELDRQLEEAQATLQQRVAALEQAEAAVVQAESNRDLAKVTDGRISGLAKLGWATLQNADQTRLGLAAQDAQLRSARANVLAARADVQAQTATVRRLRELTSFERVVAPFDGVVTARNVEVGDLISGTASGGTAMFVLQRDDLLRIHVDVPQSVSVDLRDGLPARVDLPEDPGHRFDGVVARNATALRKDSRTLSAEVDVANAEHRLRPGLFVYVRLSIPRNRPVVVLPAEAIVFNGSGLRVATLDGEARVRMVDVSIYRDFGTKVELLSGLSGGERVVIGAPANLADGMSVRVAPDARAGS